MIFFNQISVDQKTFEVQDEQNIPTTSPAIFTQEESFKCYECTVSSAPNSKDTEVCLDVNSTTKTCQSKNGLGCLILKAGVGKIFKFIFLNYYVFIRFTSAIYK